MAPAVTLQLAGSPVAMLPEAEEKKEDTCTSGNYDCRLERLERLVENQSFELQCAAKRQQQHSELQHQVVTALQVDLAAVAEGLRQAAVEQSLRRRMQDQDHKLLQLIQRKVLQFIKDYRN